MSFKEKNMKKTVNELVDTKGFEYYKLKEFCGKTLRPVGFIIHNKSKFGKSACFVFEDCFVNLPSYVVKTLESFTDDEINDIKNGKLIITNIEEGECENGTTVFFDYDDYSDEYSNVPTKALY